MLYLSARRAEMAKRKTSALSYGEKLQIIEKWAVRFAQCLVGGTITPPNDPFGDLRHEDGSYSEVKGAGHSSGALVRRKQLRTHCLGPTRDYILVFRNNRVRKDGGWDYPTLRYGTSQEALERCLLETVTEVCIVDKVGIKLLYKKLRRRRERTYQFKTGPKSYVKMRPVDFTWLVLRGFSRSSQPQSIRFEGQVVRFGETRILVRTA